MKVLVVLGAAFVGVELYRRWRLGRRVGNRPFSGITAEVVS